MNRIERAEAIGELSEALDVLQHWTEVDRECNESGPGGPIENVDDAHRVNYNERVLAMARDSLELLAERGKAEKRYVVGFLFGPDGLSLTLLRKNRPPWQAGRLNGIGGHVEDGENYEAAIVREFEEEAGAVPTTPWELFAVLGSANHRGGGSWEMACFRADGPILDGENDVGEKFEEATILAVTTGIVETIPNLRWLVPMALGDRGNWPYRIEEPTK